MDSVFLMQTLSESFITACGVKIIVDGLRQNRYIDYLDLSGK